MRHEGEPSVEEILESIKKVIARDNRETRAGRTPAARKPRGDADHARQVEEPITTATSSMTRKCSSWATRASSSSTGRRPPGREG